MVYLVFMGFCIHHRPGKFFFEARKVLQKILFRWWSCTLFSSLLFRISLRKCLTTSKYWAFQTDSNGQTKQSWKKQALWHGHPARTSMKKDFGLKKFELIFHSLFREKTMQSPRITFHHSIFRECLLFASVASHISTKILARLFF